MTVRIGITSGCEYGTIVNGWPLIYVNKAIVESIENAGAIPIVLPTVENVSLFDPYMDMIDGIIISGEVLSIKTNVIQDGGKDILQNINLLRYSNERAAISAALKRNIPLLGICRGHQVLNIVEGGTMKDKDINIGNDIIHQQGSIQSPDKGIHNISIKAGSKLQRLLKMNHLCVNSFHRQAIGQIPKGYIASAVADDGNIEAIEMDDDRFIMGLQFHPEMMKEAPWNVFFSEFIEVVKQHKSLNK
ncbi:MAG: type 1 glutamine amidotransferase [Paenibacillaceae bacterium]